jgi:hypothetical protein
MKHAKMLGLAVLAALALTALLGTGSASALVLCKENAIPCPEGQDYPAGTVIHATLETGTTSVFRDTSKNVLGTCTSSTIEGPTANTGTKEVAVEGKITSFTFGNCSTMTAVTEFGQFAIHYIGPETRGTLTFKGTKVTVKAFGVSCVYGAGAAVDIGTLKGGDPATLEVQAVVPKQEGSFLCPTHAVWEAKYELTLPEGKLYFKEEME